MGCGDEKLSKYLTQTFIAHCNAMICQQVTLSGDAEWPKVADAVIEAPHSPGHPADHAPADHDAGQCASPDHVCLVSLLATGVQPFGCRADRVVSATHLPRRVYPGTRQPKARSYLGTHAGAGRAYPGPGGLSGQNGAGDRGHAG